MPRKRRARRRRITLDKRAWEWLATYPLIRPEWKGPPDPMSPTRNVLGTELEPCSFNPLTGFFRDGCCNTGREDVGSHLVCARMTAEFLAFSVQRGNDLSTPRPEWGFPGLKPGDRWCLCVLRWVEALEAGMAPPVVLEATHTAALEFVTLANLKAHALHSPGEDQE